MNYDIVPNLCHYLEMLPRATGDETEGHRSLVKVLINYSYMCEIINLTPHKITVIGVGEFAPSGEVARVDIMREHVGVVCGVPLNQGFAGDVTGLPEKADGKFFIVSRMVKNELVNRPDCIVPDILVRDEEGNPLGCKAFSL